MARRFDYVVFDVLSGGIVGELGFTKHSWSRVLNRPGGWSGAYGLRDAEAARLHLRPGRLGVAVDLGGNILFAGPITPIAASAGDSSEVKIGGQGLLSYWRGVKSNYGRHVLGRDGMTHATGATADDVVWEDVDVFDIVADVFAHAEALAPAATPPMTVSPMGPAAGGKSGVVHSLALSASGDAKNIGELVEELSRDPGFDFGVDYSYVDHKIAPRLTLNYPIRGTDVGVSLFEKTNVSLIDQSKDGVFANVIIGIGQGTGIDTLTYIGESSSSIYPAGPMPRQEKKLVVKDHKTLEAVVGQVNAELELESTPPETATVEVIEDTDELLGRLTEGDRVYLEARDGAIDIADYYRVMSLDVDVDENAHVGFKLELASAAIFPAHA